MFAIKFEVKSFFPVIYSLFYLMYSGFNNVAAKVTVYTTHDFRQRACSTVNN